MPKLGSIRRKDVIHYFCQLGFVGPHTGGKHEYMQRGSNRVRLPNPQRTEINLPLLKELLDQAEISREEWEAV